MQRIDVQAKRLYILKLGSTWAETAQRIGDFDQWTLQALGPIDLSTEVVDIERGAPLPEYSTCAGVIMTGSHAMVTDNLDWSVATERWLPGAIDARIPILGVCYGHQLLARATGGRVDYHPDGREIGTVEVHPGPESVNDPLFGSTQKLFHAHATHAQSVLDLPPAATHLAGNDYEPNHAFRIGECTWGVQFHPEYNCEIMLEYINGLAETLRTAGRDVKKITGEVRDAPVPVELLKRFGVYVTEKGTAATNRRRSL